MFKDLCSRRCRLAFFDIRKSVEILWLLLAPRPLFTDFIAFLNFIGSENSRRLAVFGKRQEKEQKVYRSVG